MKAVVLAGGYAKRLWPLTLEQAKPMVDVNGRPIVAHILDKLESNSHIDSIIISTNAKFAGNFRDWLSTQRYKKQIKVVVENTGREEEKLGAIGGLNHVIEQEKINEDLLVIGGDNLMGLDISEMVRLYHDKKSPVVAAYDIKSLDAVRGRYGEILHSNNRITQLREKPDDPKSTLISTCCYIFPKGMHKDIRQYISEGNNRDAPGFFINWLASRKDVFVHVFDSYWYDIGDHATLEKARAFARQNLN